jgi:hypothetical protein
MPDGTFDGITVPLEEVQAHPARYAVRLERAKKSPGYAERRRKPSLSGAPSQQVIRRYSAIFHLTR